MKYKDWNQEPPWLGVSMFKEVGEWDKRDDMIYLTPLGKQKLIEDERKKKK